MPPLVTEALSTDCSRRHSCIAYAGNTWKQSFRISVFLCITENDEGTSVSCGQSTFSYKMQRETFTPCKEFKSDAVVEGFSLSRNVSASSHVCIEASCTCCGELKNSLHCCHHIKEVPLSSQIRWFFVFHLGNSGTRIVSWFYCSKLLFTVVITMFRPSRQSGKLLVLYWLILNKTLLRGDNIW